MHSAVTIPNMRPGEEVEIVLRRHWIIYVILWIYFFSAVIGTVFIWIYFWLNGFLNLCIVVFWMGFALFLFMEWLNHELDTYVITNKRVIGIEQISFLNRVVSECNLAQIQEVNSSTEWLFSNILNYGILTLQTAGRSTHFTMEYCPNILENARLVLNVVDQFRDSSPGYSNNSLGDQKRHTTEADPIVET